MKFTVDRPFLVAQIPLRFLPVGHGKWTALVAAHAPLTSSAL